MNMILSLESIDEPVEAPKILSPVIYDVFSMFVNMVNCPIFFKIVLLSAGCQIVRETCNDFKDYVQTLHGGQKHQNQRRRGQTNRRQ